MKTLHRWTSVVIVVVLILNMNHDFLDGTYAGASWLRPIDFVMTQFFVALVAWRLFLSHYYLEKEDK